MKLYLMRHGEAASPQQDPEKGLTAAGRADIERLAKQLKQKGIQINQVFHSERTRARQTAEIMAQYLAPEVELKVHAHIKPDDNPEHILEEINHWQEDTLITSHLPFIPNLLALLAGDISTNHAISFGPGTVVCLEKSDNATWHRAWITSP